MVLVITTLKMVEFKEKETGRKIVVDSIEKKNSKILLKLFFNSCMKRNLPYHLNN
jgi:hypothetical protein